MRLTPISSVCKIIMGQAPKGDTYNDKGIGLPLIAGASDFGELTPASSRFTSAPSKVSEIGDVILCIRATIGDLNWSDEVYCLGRGVAGLRADTRLINRQYLWRVIEANADKLSALGRGATFKQISKTDIADFEIPLPSLDEQKRIAAILDQADALRRLRTRAIERLNTLGQSIFYEMFGDLVANEKHFKPFSVGEFVAGFDTGKNLAPDPDNQSARNRVLKVSAVTKGTFRPEEAKPLPDSYDPPSNHFVRTGDLLFSRANTALLIGATALVEEETSNLVLPDKIWRFVWGDENTPEPLFVHYLFQSPSFRSEISKRASGTSGSMKNISKPKVMGIRVGLPSGKEQRAFAKLVHGVNRQKKAVIASCEVTETLFASLQKRAFRGEL